MREEELGAVDSLTSGMLRYFLAAPPSMQVASLRPSNSLVPLVLVHQDM